MNKLQIAAKNYLMRAYRIDKRINSKLDQIASLNDLATRATSDISDMPGSRVNILTVQHLFRMVRCIVMNTRRFM